MNAKEYQEVSKETANYPHPTLGEVAVSYVYPGFGLVGELAELMESCLKKDVENIIKEGGDCLWYIHDLRRIFSIDAAPNLQLFYDKEAQTFEAIPIESLDFSKYTSAIFSHISKLSSIFKKSIRDNEGILPDKYHDELEDTLEKLYVILYEIFISIGYSLSAARRMNKEKLFSRKERGVIGGDGDNR